MTRRPRRGRISVTPGLLTWGQLQPKSAFPYEDSYPQVSRPGVTDIATSTKSLIHSRVYSYIIAKVFMLAQPLFQHLYASAYALQTEVIGV